MTHLNEQALEAAREQPGTNHEGIIRAYLSALPSSPVSELVERLERRANTMNGSLVGASDGRTYALGYYNQLAAKDDKEAASTLTSLSTRNAELEREVKRLREAAGNAYRACMSAWACGEPPHRVKTMIEEVERLGVVIGEAGAAALSSAAVAEREPVAVVVGHHAESGNRIEWLRDLAPVGSKLYLDPPPTSELEAENARLREALRSVETQADNAAWNIGKPGHKFTTAEIQAGYFSIRDFARRVREGGKVDD